jgi:GTP cyclohydrolase I
LHTELLNLITKGWLVQQPFLHFHRKDYIMTIDQEQIEHAVKLLIIGMGGDPNSEPFVGTPNRYYRFLEEIFGINNEIIKTFPEEQYEGPVTLQGHQAWSLCPHHLLPTNYTIDVTYVPNNMQVLGLSKLPRLINQVIKREGPALQERMTQHICNALVPYSKFVHVIVRGEHLCTKMRGVKTTGNMLTEARYVQPKTEPAIVKPHLVV